VASTRAQRTPSARTGSKTEPLEGAREPRVGVVLRDAARLMVGMLRVYLEEWDLSITHYLVLRDIAESPGGNQQTVSNNINVAAPAIVSALAELEKRGLIERMRNDQDRRSSVLYLTAAGRRLARRVLGRAGSISADATIGMSATEAEILRDLLFRVKHNLQEKLRTLEGS
jgi:DNA-binding MarR family transcriptional regulator